MWTARSTTPATPSPAAAGLHARGAALESAAPCCWGASDDVELFAAFAGELVAVVLDGLAVAGDEVRVVVKAWSRLHAMFPDIQVIVEDMLVEADEAAVRTSLHGIPAGVEEQALPSMMEIFRVRDGRIVELWGLSSLSRPGR